MVLLLVWLLLLAFLLDDQFKGLLQLFFFPQSSIVLVLWGSFAYDNTNLRSWLLVVKVKTMLIAASSFFNLHGRLCLLTSHLLLIYGYSYKYCVLVNYKWNNSRPRIFFVLGPLFFMITMFLFVFGEKFHSQKLFFCPSICYLDSLDSNGNVPLDAVICDRNRTSFHFESCSMLSLVF
jgi:hypothetical protein